MTSSQSSRPTTDLSDVLLDSLDDMVDQLMRRLDGLTRDEYLWEPIDNPGEVWSVRDHAASAPLGRVDASDDRDIDPAPVTTMAWRLWHLSIDCFDDYTRRFHGDTGEPDRRWTMDPASAIESLHTNWQAFRAAVVERPDLWDELGDDFGPWSRHCVGDFVMHASNELVHHGAEIALLRDLYRHRSAG